MVDLPRVASLLAERRPGHALPQAFYTDDDLFAFDMAAIYGTSWILVGFEAELPRAGSHLALTIGLAPVIVVRGHDGVIRGFHNTCRHRGSRIIEEGKGTSARLVCPYHRWTYDLAGDLVSAPRMGEAFAACDHSLGPVRVETCAGAIFVCTGEDPPDFAPFRDRLGPMLGAHDLAHAKLAHESVLVERANWKLAMENARECYHCATGHPELSLTFPTGVSANFDYGEDARRQAEFNARLTGLGLDVGPYEGDWWQAIRFPLNDGCKSMTLDGEPAVSRPMVALGDGDIGSLRWAVEPHSFVHATADHLFMFSALPVSARETHIVAKWLVHADAVEGVDYELDTLTALWDRTNLQDQKLVETNQEGVASPGYRPGPYSTEAEALTLRFTDWYCDRARSWLEARNVRV